MSSKKFSALLVAALMVILAVALLVPGQTGRDEMPESDLLLPDLAARVNEIDRITVAAAGDDAGASLERGEESWRVSDLGGYPADWEKVRDLLAGLAQARMVEVKTANPEYYDRLGVEDIAPGAAGVLVSLGAGDESYAVVVGKNADGRSGRYLRLADSTQSVLSDFEANVPRTAADWTDKQVTDIPADDVAEVAITHADGDELLARKATADEADFTLVNLPEDREIESSWAVNSLGGTLASLQFDSVQGESAVDFTAATRFRLLTYSGLEVRLEAVRVNEQHWVRLSASVPFADPGDEEAAAVEAEIAEQAEAINARTGGWAYQVQAYKFEAMTKRLEAVLKPLDDES